MAVAVRWGSTNSEAMNGQACKGDTALNYPSHQPLSPFQNEVFPLGECSLPTLICKYKYMLIVNAKHLLISQGVYIYSQNVY